MHRISVKLSTRKCRGVFCRSVEPHSHHLTIIGRIRYTSFLGPVKS
jgi:hypothetical protein